MLRKYATTEILSAQIAPQDQAGLRRMAHRHSFEYEPRPGYLYVRSRAISSRTNDNFDTFPAEEIKKAYSTFVGKPVFVNHNNDNHRRARGVVIDAALHEDTNPDGSPDTWAEVLMEVDAVRFPKLAKAILAGHIDRTSMGTDVKFSVCSVCNNKASTPLEYCKHIPKMKGQRIYRTTASGKKEGVLVSEICHGLGFFENSLLVEEPADPTAFFLGVDDHSTAKTATRKEAEWVPPVCDTCGKDHRTESHDRMAKTEAFWAKQDEHRRAGLCDCPGSIKIQQHKPEHHAEWSQFQHAEGKTDAWGHPLMQPYDGHSAWACNNYKCAEHPQELYPQDDEKLTAAPGWFAHDHDPDRDIKREVNKTLHEVGQNPNDAAWVLKQNPDGPTKYSSKTAMGPAGVGSDEGDMPGNGAQPCVTCGKEIYYVEGSGWLHDIDGAAGVPHKAAPMEQEPMGGNDMMPQGQGMGIQQMPGSPMPMDSSSTYASLRAEAKGPAYPNPADHPSYQHLGMHADNVIEHWNAATEDEVAGGMRWYEDAHHVAKAISGGNAHVGAGVLSAYSPQQNWPANMFNAARSFINKKAVRKADNIKKAQGYEGHGGFSAMDDQANAAERIMGGEHHQDVLGGPKTQDFAHLIEHAGRNPETGEHSQKVVIDRHAASVLAGRRLSGKEDEDHLKKCLGTRHYYEHAAEMYRQAAKHISKHVGYEVAPHQVQAVTWAVRQRRNEEGVYADNNKRQVQFHEDRLSAERTHRDFFNDHMRQHLPEHVNEQAPYNMHYNASLVYGQSVQKTASDGPEWPEGFWDEVKANAPDHSLAACTDLKNCQHHAPLDAMHLPDGRAWDDASHMTHDPGYGFEWIDQKPMGGWGPTKPFKPERMGFDVADRPGTHQLQSLNSLFPVLAYGETMAPADVDTLRDEECPVCGEADAYDGNRCDVCGFDAPPKMFQDPDLDKAKQMDLRGDAADAQAADPNGDGMPDVIPGSGAPGPSDMPLDPSQVPDPEDVAQQQVNDIAESGQPMDPNALDANGQPIDPAQMALQEPQEQDPNAEPMEDEDIAGANPGTPGDDVADLTCMTCGYQAPADAPQSMDMSDPAPTTGEGASGAPCPQCGKDVLVSLKQVNEQSAAQGQPGIPAAKV